MHWFKEEHFPYTAQPFTLEVDYLILHTITLTRLDTLAS